MTAPLWGEPDVLTVLACGTGQPTEEELPAIPARG